MKQISQVNSGQTRKGQRQHWWLALAALLVLWQIAAHMGGQHGAPTLLQATPKNLSQAHERGQQANAAELAGASAPVPRAELVVVPGELPDHNKTPGDVFESVTLADLRVIGYSKKVRNVPSAERDAVLAEYGVPWAQRYDVECDHLIPLSWGGSNSIKNLWPEKWDLNVNGKNVGAHTKDILEELGLELIRAGRLDLHTAQKEISTNWIAMYERLIGPLPDYHETATTPAVPTDLK